MAGDRDSESSSGSVVCEPIPVCIPVHSNFMEPSMDDHNCLTEDSTVREEPSKRLGPIALFANAAVGLADALIKDDRPAAGNLTDMCKFKKPPKANAIRRQVSSLKDAVSHWTGIPRLTVAKIIKAAFLTAFVFVGIGVFLRGESNYYCDNTGQLEVLTCFLPNSTTPITVSDLTSDESGCGWTLIDALYFSVATVSTVGYGDLSPSSPATKAFAVCFIMVGIVAIFPRISSVVTTLTAPTTAAGRRALDKLLPPIGIDITGDGVEDFRAPRHPLIYYPKNLLPSIFLWWVIQAVSAAIFVAIEPHATYWIWLYHCLVTATTVGYGDVAITTQGGRLWAVFHIVLSVCGLADLLQTYGTLQRERRSAVAQMRQLNQQLDPKLMDMLLGHARRLRPSMQRDGEGLFDLEFVLAMLIELDVISLKQVKPFLKQFQAMDVDGDGRVGRKDIEKMLQAAEVTEVVCTPPSILRGADVAKRHRLAADSQGGEGRGLEAGEQGAEVEEEVSGDERIGDQSGMSEEGGGGEDGGHNGGTSGGGGTGAAQGISGGDTGAGQAAGRGLSLPGTGEGIQVEMQGSDAATPVALSPAAAERRGPYPPGLENLMMPS